MNRSTAKSASSTGTVAVEEKTAGVFSGLEPVGAVSNPLSVEWPEIKDDHALPGLALLRQANLRTKTMSHLLARWLGSEVQLLESSAVPLCYVPGKRCSFQIELVTHAPGAGIERTRVAGKIYGEDHGAKVYRTLHLLWRRGFSTGLFAVPRPLAYDEDRKLLLLTWADGELLRSDLLAGSDVSQRIEEAAAWLLRLHHCGMTRGRRYTFRRHLYTLGLQGQRLAQVCPDSAGLLKNLLRRIEGLGGDLSGWTPGPTHRDFSPDHVVSSGGKVTALDFDEFCQYDPLFDVAHFVAHLRLLGLRHFGAMTRLNDLAQHFQTAYRAGAREYSEARLHLYEGVAYFKLAHIIAVLRRPPGWKETADALLSEAQRMLSRPF
jgi:hypothetical protein